MMLSMKQILNQCQTPLSHLDLCPQNHTLLNLQEMVNCQTRDSPLNKLFKITLTEIWKKSNLVILEGLWDSEEISPIIKLSTI